MTIAAIKNTVRRALGIELRGLSIDLTSVCNIACTTCSLADHYTLPKKLRMNQELLERLRWAFEHSVWVALQCNCEPLLHKGIADVIRFIKGVNPAIRVSFVTNAMLLTAARAEDLVRSGVDEIGVSIDGATRETFEEIRVGAVFDTVLANVRGLIEARQRLGSATPSLQVISVACRRNLGELVDILELAADLGASNHAINGLEPYTEAMASEVLYRLEGVDEEAEAVFRRLREVGEARGVRVVLPRLTIQPYTTCDLRSCIVDASGQVFPCATLSYERPFYFQGEAYRHPQVCVGSVAERPFEEIWNSDSYRRFRGELRDGVLPESCQRCLFNHRVTCPSD